MDELKRETALSLARIVLAPGFRFTDQPPSLAELDQAIVELENMLPLSRQEPGLIGPVSSAFETALRPIGAALDPKMSPEQARAWRKAMLVKFSDLPGVIAVKAATKAVHSSFEFFNQVDGAIRALANEALKQQETAVWKLKKWREETERALNPPPALPPPPEEPMTEEDVAELNAIFRRIGSATRYEWKDGEIIVHSTSSSKAQSENGENPQDLTAR